MDPAVSTPVEVVILHPGARPEAGPLTRAVAAARSALAERHRTGFVAAGAASARVVSGPAEGSATFGARLRSLRDGLPGRGGLVVLGSGAIPLATTRDRAAFIAAAASDEPRALANNRYSADVIAVACAREMLADLPDLATDNALPRWLEARGIPVADLRGRWRLGVDIDGPLDLVLLGGRWARELDAASIAPVRARLAAIQALAADPRAELVVAGRTSAGALRWLERTMAARTRALVEERGLRTSAPGQRPPASVLGALLERDGPGTFGAHLARLGEAAVVDTRVLLAHRLGPDVAAWPSDEDRFASDVLAADAIADPWLRALTASAATAAIPILLGGHTLVGPGLRLAVGGRHG